MILFWLPKLFWPTVRKTCSSDRGKNVEIQGWGPRIRTIFSNSERSEQFLVTECFLTCSWRFLRSTKLEQVEFKLEKNIFGFRNMEEMLEKEIFTRKMPLSQNFCQWCFWCFLVFQFNNFFAMISFSTGKLREKKCFGPIRFKQEPLFLTFPACF